MFPYHTNIIKGEQNTMKRKAVKGIYEEMCEPIGNLTANYKRGVITFTEYLQNVVELYNTVYFWPYDSANAGTITTNEADLIHERFQQFVKKEIKNACKA